MNLNQNVLQEVISWGADLDGFKTAHAVDALTMAQGYVEGVTDNQGKVTAGIGPTLASERPMFLMALDLAWLLWLDDRFDTHASSAQQTDWRAVVRAFTEPPTTAEGQGILRARAHMAKEAPRHADYQLWVDTALAAFGAYHQEELMSRGEQTWSYSQYIENGELSSSLPHFVATVSLAYNYRFADRLSDPQHVRIVRNLAVATRLQNDLASAEKERRDGDQANAVLLMERYLPLAQARAFVLDEMRGYERLLNRDLDTLPPDDPWPLLARIILASGEHFYRIPRERYTTG